MIPYIIIVLYQLILPYKTFWGKWFRSMFTGIPFTLDNDVVMFQVFPDCTGTSLNAVGNACDQGIVYGKVNNGSINLVVVCTVLAIGVDPTTPWRSAEQP